MTPDESLSRSGFEALVREHHAAVFRSAMRIVRDDDGAAEWAQQVFLRGVERQERLETAEDPGRVLRWLAAKGALAFARAAGTRRRKESEHAMSTHEAHLDSSSR